MDKLKNKKVSALGALGLSIGTAIGWGSFVVTGSSFLSKAGPLGSIIGIVIGIMCIVGKFIITDMVVKYIGILLIVYSVISFAELILIKRKK